MHDQGPRQVPPPDSQAPRRHLPPDAECAKPKQSPVPLRAPCGESFAPWIPDSKLPTLPKNSVNSLIRKILLATPEFPRFYADFILALAPNSNEAKILRPHYQKILAKVNDMSNDHSCTHIKVTGVRCDSPALRGEQFCYFHQNAHRGVRRPQQSRLHPIAIIEDEESIQYALMEVINALMRNTIDVKRATLIIRALHIAVKNAARVKFGIHDKDAVTQVPNYAPPTAEQEEIAMQSELPAVSAIPYKPVEPTNPHFWEYSEEGARILAREAQAAKAKPSPSVGTDAFVRPGREATVPTAAAPTNAKVVTSASAEVPPHDFKKVQPAPSAKPSAVAAPARTPGTAADAAKKKTPASVTAPAPQERKITAHAARRG